MTDAAPDALRDNHALRDAAAQRDSDARRAWRIGGVLLIACAAVSVVMPFLQMSTGGAGADLARTALFSAALVMFALGVRGAGSVVDRRPLGVAALLVLAAWPFVDRVFEVLVPFTMERVELYMAWGYISLTVQLAAAIIAVVAIARAGVVPRSWRWAPLWALGAVMLPQLILSAVAASPGSDMATMAAVVGGLSQLVAIGVPLCLGILAIALAGRRAEAPPVQIYPPVG